MRINFSGFGLYLAIIASSMFYTLPIMWVITEFNPLEGYYWLVADSVFLAILIIGFRFFVPKLRKAW